MPTEVNIYTKDAALNRLCNQLQRWHEDNYGIEGLGYVKHVLTAHKAGIPLLRAAIDHLIVPPGKAKLQTLYNLILTGDRLEQWWDLEFHHANTRRWLDAELAAKLSAEVLSEYVINCRMLVKLDMLQLPEVRAAINDLMTKHRMEPSPHPPLIMATQNALLSASGPEIMGPK